MSGITFGSVGDIIAVGQIALQLVKALSDSRGSAKEYQALVKELQNFDQVLLQVIALWQNYDESPALVELGRITNHVLKESRDELLRFREKIDRKYGVGLSPEGSGHWIKDASKKFGWLGEKGDVMDLRLKLQMACGTINLLCNTALGSDILLTSNRLDYFAQKERTEGVHAMLRDQVSQINKMEERLVSQAKTSGTMLVMLKSGMGYLCQVRTIVVDMRSILSTVQNHILSMQATPYGLGTQWQQEPVTLEDALGRLFPIPLETIKSWKALDAIVAEHFEGRPGHDKIQRREYIIEDGLNGLELSRAVEFALCVRPGQKVSMCMVFLGDDSIFNTCPRCPTRADASIGSRVQCRNISCKMWFQRISEVKVDEQKADLWLLVQLLQYKSALSPRGSNSDRDTTLGEISTLPSDFQRVKILLRRRYRCIHTGCTKTFANCFHHFRHISEAHKPTRRYLCPIAGCSRGEGMGYTRADKLTENLWKIHGDLGYWKA